MKPTPTSSKRLGVLNHLVSCVWICLCAPLSVSAQSEQLGGSDQTQEAKDVSQAQFESSKVSNETSAKKVHDATVVQNAEAEKPRLSASQARIQKFENEKLKALNSIAKLTRKLRQLATQKSRFEEERVGLEAQVHEIESKILPLREDLAKQKVAVRQQVLNLYKLSGAEFIKSLFSSESPMRLERRAKFITIKLDRDLKNLRSYRKKISVLRIAQDSIKQKIDVLIGLEKNIANQEFEIKLENQTKQNIVQRIEGLRRELLDINRKNKLNLSNESYRSLLNQALSQIKGQMDWPVQGSIKHKFGVVRDSELRTQVPLRGIVISALPRSEVWAVADSEVVLSQAIPGYGRVLLLDHGHNYYTLYGLLADTPLKKGDTVKKMQSIGRTGFITQRFGAGLYFEMRHFSEPEDPLRWLKKKSMNISQLQDGGTFNAQRD